MQRNKKSQHTESTSKFMKSKYLDNKKPTIPSTTNKIMLTDLCPQEKAKIGELIKTLEQRKKQNQDLQEQLNSWKSNYMTLDKVKTELENLIQAKNYQVRKLSQELNKIQQEKMQKDIELHEVRLELEKYVKKINLEGLKLSCGTNTTTVQTSNQETQTKQKKKKQKDRQVQVNTIQQFGGMEQRQTRKNNFYQPNSKSFDKIMKGERLLSSDKKNYQTAAFRDDDNFGEGQISLGGSSYKNQPKSTKRQSSNIEQFYGNKELRASELEENDNKNWSEYGEQQSAPHQKSTQEQIQVEDTENDDDEFEMLAKKWLQLKEKNIQQLTQGYFLNQNEDPSLNVNLKSLGIQSKLRNNNQRKAEENEQQDQVDEDQLNRALKSKDFSASRLLNNSRSKRNISQTSEKKSMQNSQSSYRNFNTKNQQKSNIQTKVSQNVQKKNLEISQERNLPRPKYSVEQSSRGVDFYSAELLDLVEEMNK